MSAGDVLVVLGGRSLVADFLLARVRGRFDTICLVSRGQARSSEAGVESVHFESLASGVWTPPNRAVLISLLPLPALVPLLPRFAASGAIVALSSTRRFSGAQSQDAKELAAAQALVTAETQLAEWCTATGVRYTVLRPTLIYDMKRDLNLARMARFIARFRMLPLAWPAKGLRQPIHADDVAKALVGTLDRAGAANRMFNIAGGERLTYRAMAERVFRALGVAPRLILLPPWLLRVGFGIAGRARLVRNASFGSSIFQRMNEDLVFEVDDGLEALGYAPRFFDPRP